MTETSQTTSDSPPKKIPVEDMPDVDQGTHPVAMLGLVCGIASIFTMGCFCMVPATAPYLQGLFGASAVVMSVLSWVRVRAGRWHESNMFQARLGLILGCVGLCFAIFWVFFLGRFGWMPFIPQGGA